jgi:hypothetical protein
MNQSPMIKTAGVGVSDNDVIFEIASNAENFDTWQLGSTAGAMDVFVSGDGTNYQSAAVALIDLGSTAPSTAVVVTTAGGNYGIKGRWKKIKVLQNGGTGVANAFLIGYQS